MLKISSICTFIVQYFIKFSAFFIRPITFVSIIRIFKPAFTLTLGTISSPTAVLLSQKSKLPPKRFGSSAVVHVQLFLFCFVLFRFPYSILPRQTIRELKVYRGVHRRSCCRYTRHCNPLTKSYLF